MRNFVTYADSEHSLLQEIPQVFQNIWFHQYESGGERLCLAMERILQFPEKEDSPFVDLLTFEIASVQELLEWEEEFGDKPFVALDPDYIFFEESVDEDKALFSIGRLHDMEFIPELEIVISIISGGLEIDFQDGGETQKYHKL